MNILFDSLKRTNTSFPSEWEGKTSENKTIKISYRCGEIKIFMDDELEMITEKDQFDIGGYLSDEELYVVLEREKLLCL